MADRKKRQYENDEGEEEGQELKPLGEGQEERNDNVTKGSNSNDDNRCGVGPLSCRSMQFLAHPIVYTSIMNLVVIFQISAVGVYVSGSLSTIEKRFQLKSSESGFITTINDIMGMVFVIPITYFGHKLHRPRIVACGTLLIGLGTMLCAVPQFIYENPNKHSIKQSNLTTVFEDYCILGSNQGRNGSTECSAKDIADAGSQMDKAMWFIIGQALCGFGQSPVWPLTLTFLDDNVAKASMPAYIALFFASTTIAPIFGFVLSSACLSLDVDFYKTSSTTQQPDDPNFIGAWWLGYLINGSALCFLSLLVFCFPKVLRRKSFFKKKTNLTKKKPPKVQALDYADMMKGPTVRDGASLTTLITDFLKTIKRLFTNLAYVCVVGSLIAEVAIISGFGMFSAKYVQKQYGIPASRASLILGFLLTPAGLLGVCTCGVFLKRVPLAVRGFARMAAITAALGLVFASCLMAAGCKNSPVAGLTVQYHQHTGSLRFNGHNLPNTTAACNSDCSCKKGKFTPVCGTDGITYVSACHAGCTQQDVAFDENGQEFTYYKDCACIPSDQEGVNPASTPSMPILNYAKIGQCDDDCDKLVAFALLYALVVFINSWVKNPTLMLLLRVVHEDDRTIALGFNSISIKLLGFLPAPIYFGAAIESSCLLWNESCGRTGDCLVYDLAKFRRVYIGLFLCMKTISFLGFSSVGILAERAHAKSGQFQQLPTSDKNAIDDGIENGEKMNEQEQNKNTIHKYEQLSNDKGNAGHTTL